MAFIRRSTYLEGARRAARSDAPSCTRRFTRHGLYLRAGLWYLVCNRLRRAKRSPIDSSMASVAIRYRRHHILLDAPSRPHEGSEGRSYSVTAKTHAWDMRKWCHKGSVVIQLRSYLGGLPSPCADAAWSDTCPRFRMHHPQLDSRRYRRHHARPGEP